MKSRLLLPHLCFTSSFFLRRAAFVRNWSRPSLFFDCCAHDARMLFSACRRSLSISSSIYSLSDIVGNHAVSYGSSCCMHAQIRLPCTASHTSNIWAIHIWCQPSRTRHDRRHTIQRTASVSLTGTCFSGTINRRRPNNVDRVIEEKRWINRHWMSQLARASSRSRYITETAVEDISRVRLLLIFVKGTEVTCSKWSANVLLSRLRETENETLERLFNHPNGLDRLCMKMPVFTSRSCLIRID